MQEFWEAIVVFPCFLCVHSVCNFNASKQERIYNYNGCKNFKWLGGHSGRVWEERETGSKYTRPEINGMRFCKAKN